MRKEFARLRRRTFLTPLWLMAFVGVLALAGGIWLVATASTTTVLVMRHAEKASDGSNDPPLSAAGEARAARLARLLGAGPPAERVQVIYATQFKRTRQTAAPVGAALGVAVTILGADETDQLVAEVLREHRGGRVLVVGHSNTVPAIVAALGGGPPPTLGEGDYGDLFVVAVPRYGRASVLRMRVE